LIESKPKFDGVDYRKPVKLIAIAPSFHIHNFVGKAYHRLNFEFFTFGLTVNNSTGDIFFELTHVDTKEKYIEQVPEIKRNKVIKCQEVVKVEINYDEMIDYYMRLNYSSKLGLDPLSPEQLRERSAKHTSKCTKEWSILASISRQINRLKSPRIGGWGADPNRIERDPALQRQGFL
jgi:hypothetical protein